jgi:ATP-dependent DNA helicase RecG
MSHDSHRESELSGIIGAGESESLEFKSSFNQDVVETAAAFANTRGGRIILGVSDSGVAIGASFGREVLRDFVNRVSNSTQPSVIADRLEREEIWDYPLAALREGLMNAVCHRDYGDLADIQIKIFDDALQIWSPGFLPFGVTLEELHQPTHSSKPRNRLIAQVFYDMGMIEKYGSGTGRVLKVCKAAGLPEPEFGNYSGGFRVLFRSQVSEAGPKVGTPHVTPHVAPHVTPHVNRLIEACEGEMSRPELQRELGLKDRMNFKRVYLAPALDLGLVELTKPDAPRSTAQKYRLTEKGKSLLVDQQ